MSRDGSNIYSAPAGTLAVSGTPIESAKYNAFVNDLVADANLPRPIVAGGTGATTAGAALVNFGLTATAAELNTLDGITATVAELNVLDGIPGTLTATEIGYLDGVTSAIQTQLNAKQAAGNDLTAIEALPGTGIAVRTASDTWAQRTIVSADGSVTITNPAGVAGDIDLSAAPWTYATPTATTSGSTFDFSGIPSTVSEIEVMLRNVSLSAGDSLRIQAIVSGSPVASGYVSYSGGTGGGLTTVGSEGTNGFSIALENSTRAFSGTMRLSRYSTGNQWNAFHAGWAGGSGSVAGGGEVSLSGALEGIRLTRTGASTFDSGQWNIRYR